MPSEEELDEVKDCKKKHIRSKGFTRASTSMMLAAWEWL